jgi:hypothetical protein
MKEFQHKELAKGKWQQYSLIEQMANIGSEVGRSIKWFRVKDIDRFESSFDRALELFDLTLADERWKGRRKEIARSREIFCTLLLEPEKVTNLQKELNWLDEYFLQFGIAANYKRGK